MKTSYHERDYAFGSAMLTLRTEIGLTQAGLANKLGISRRAVGEWEAGSSYPKVEHLKALIELGVQSRAFPTENEAREIRVLWKAAHQKVPLDERWLSALLNQRGLPAPVAGQEQSGGDKGQVEETISSARNVVHPRPRVDWGDTLTVPLFYGREEELAQLSVWIVQEHCRVVSVLGMGGIGKSALSVSTMHQISGHFDVVIFRSLRDAPSCEALLDGCLQVLSPQSPRLGPAPLEQRISRLLEHLRTDRTLVVLDNMECLLKDGDTRGRFRSGFEGYGRLLHRVAEAAHQSCLLITSREKPTDLRSLEGKLSPVRTLRLTGLDAAACKQILVEKEVVGTEADRERLIERYGGNPLALKIVGETIIDLFGGEITAFLVGETALFGSITDLLGEQFIRLSALEQSVLCWLTIMREPVTLDELQKVLVTPLPHIQVIEAIDACYRRSLLERGKRPGSFTLQSVVLEYVTIVLITEGSREIHEHRLDRLLQYGLSQAKAREYIRQTQERLLLSPLLASLQNIYRRRAKVEEQLLGSLRGQDDDAQGYGSANLIALLRLLRGNLSGLDLSHLSIRGAYLQGIEMQDTSLCRSQMRECIFTSAVSAVRAVTIAPSGKWWASGGMQGKVRIWEEGGQTLQHIWQAHTDLVYSLAFSPDGRTLASGSRDGTLKLWDVENGALLWTGWQNTIVCLAFTPYGNLLASAGLDGTVCLWDAQSGTNLQVLAHQGPVYAVVISPDGSLLASGGFDGAIRLWEIKMALPYAPSISIQSDWVMSLAFSPDGRTLASGHWDQTVKLWEVASGQLRQTLSGHTDHATYVAWSPDGRILASCNKDKTIRLWNVEQGDYRAVLHGHTADVDGIVFTPDSKSLLSSSEDGTLRVWDMECGKSLRVIAGYAVSLYCLDWSPDGRYLVSGGTDGCVSIWDQSGKMPPRELHGHNWAVSGVGWSPDGRFIASCGWDRSLRLWDPISGECRQIFENPSTLLLSTAWSPDGRSLACGTYLRGMQVWDMVAYRLRWIGQPHLTAFYSTAWSPSGTLLIGSSGNGNGSLYLWESADGTLQRRMQGHRGRVTSVVWSPDGKWLASGSGSREGGELFVWDVKTGECVQTFTGHPEQAAALAWTSGDKLISGGSDGKLRWWNVQSEECISTLEAHQGTIRSLKVSPDGKTLASCGDDGTIMIWNMESGEHLRTLRRDRPYERLNITGIRGLTEAEIASLRALGAIG